LTPNFLSSLLSSPAAAAAARKHKAWIARRKRRGAIPNL